MTGSRILAVIGATGAQGSGLCEAILNDRRGGFACRAITRNPGSDAAKALAARGAEVVRAPTAYSATRPSTSAGGWGSPAST